MGATVQLGRTALAAVAGKKERERVRVRLGQTLKDHGHSQEARV